MTTPITAFSTILAQDAQPSTPPAADGKKAEKKKDDKPSLETDSFIEVGTMANLGGRDVQFKSWNAASQNLALQTGVFEFDLKVGSVATVGANMGFSIFGLYKNEVLRVTDLSQSEIKNSASLSMVTQSFGGGVGLHFRQNKTFRPYAEYSLSGTRLCAYNDSLVVRESCKDGSLRVSQSFEVDIDDVEQSWLLDQSVQLGVKAPLGQAVDVSLAGALDLAGKASPNAKQEMDGLQLRVGAGSGNANQYLGANILQGTQLGLYGAVTWYPGRSTKSEADKKPAESEPTKVD